MDDTTTLIVAAVAFVVSTVSLTLTVLTCWLNWRDRR